MGGAVSAITGGILGGEKKPAPAPAPVAAPVAAAAAPDPEEEARRLRGGQGASSTILNPLGADVASGASARRVLLG